MGTKKPETTSSNIEVGSMTNAAIQQSSPGATQSLTFTSQKKVDVAEIVKEMVALLDKLGLSADLEKEAKADIGTVQAQMTKVEPSPGIIKEALKSLKNVLEGATNSAAAAGMTEAVHALIEKIKSILAS